MEHSGRDLPDVRLFNEAGFSISMTAGHDGQTKNIKINQGD